MHVTQIGLGLMAVLLVSGPSALGAQEADRGAAAEHDSAAAPRNSLVPLPVAFYMPETNLGFGGLVTYYMYDPRQQAQRVLPSTLSAIGIYTTKKQIIALLNAELYLDGDKYRLLGGGGYSKFPSKFWGIGNEASDELEEDYTPRMVNFSGEFQWQVLPGWYVGGTVQAAYRELTDVAEDGQLASGLVPGSDDGTIMGAGLLFTRDTRNNAVYPSAGSYHQVRATLYSGTFGSDYAFGHYVLDLRKYVSPVADHVLAFRGLAELSSGQPPFDLLPQLGGDVLLRGYYQGRFRDRQLVAAQAEYRAPVWWRLGAVGFAGVGQVRPSLDGLTWGGFKASVGGGLRVLLDPRSGLNIRADYGWAFDTKTGGFYLNIGEAF
jgi:outer membrane protein assembly factor BamA